MTVDPDPPRHIFPASALRRSRTGEPETGRRRGTEGGDGGQSHLATGARPARVLERICAQMPQSPEICFPSASPGKPAKLPHDFGDGPGASLRTRDPVNRTNWIEGSA
jgi:hypothetical protein